MSGSDDFLRRWSRRKRESVKGASGSEADTIRPDEVVSAKDKEPEHEKQAALAPTSAKVDVAEPIFDLTKLPPIESITATTDIRPFLASGVPAELTRAALRRAWLADPAIRDYIGLSENSWDFNAPGTPGFDLSPPTGDLKRMVAEIMRSQPAEQPEQPPPEAKSDSTAAGHPPSLQDEPAGPLRDELTSHSIVKPEPEARTEPEPKSVSDQMIMAEHEKNDAASQHNEITSEDRLRVTKRNQGGALPQ